jgi:glycerophosphoryl diester phosphodiesterase
VTSDGAKGLIETETSMGRPRLAAHRGGAGLWPENSLGAFAGALSLGIDLLELDVHQSADGEVVVVHDPTLDRTTEGAGPVRALPAATLRTLRLRGRDGTLTDEHVPMLDEVLSLAVRTGAELLLEIKGPGFGVRYGPGAAVRGPVYDGLEARVLRGLEAAGMLTRTTVMAFNPAVIETVRALAPSQRTTLLVSRAAVESASAGAADVIGWARRLGVTDVGLEHTLIDADLVSAARAGGLRVGAWTPNDEPALRRLFDLGVDLITTDRPDLALRIRHA